MLTVHFGYLLLTVLCVLLSPAPTYVCTCVPSVSCDAICCHNSSIDTWGRCTCWREKLSRTVYMHDLLCLKGLLDVHSHCRLYLLAQSATNSIVSTRDTDSPHPPHSGRWYYSFQDQLVGVSKNSRLHGLSDGEPPDVRDFAEAAAMLVNNISTESAAENAMEVKNWVYLKNLSMPQSIVLPSGMVYHRKYLGAYLYVLLGI